MEEYQDKNLGKNPSDIYPVVGRRRVFWNTQVDDMHLATYLYEPVGGRFRARPSDLDHHVAWQTNFNARLPAGSTYFIEIGHNGNGNVEWAINNDTQGICVPNDMIEYDAPADTALDFIKPLGTGVSVWPDTPTSYVWQVKCIELDDLVNWFRVSTNRDHFAHISHTFTHESLDNATYSDTNKEIFFNVGWLAQTGISAASKFSSNSLIPPAITGIHNGDAIKAWMDNGIKYVVGDSSRPLTLSTVSSFIPLHLSTPDNLKVQRILAQDHHRSRRWLRRSDRHSPLVQPNLLQLRSRKLHSQ